MRIFRKLLVSSNLFSLFCIVILLFSGNIRGLIGNLIRTILLNYFNLEVGHVEQKVVFYLFLFFMYGFILLCFIDENSSHKNKLIGTLLNSNPTQLQTITNILLITLTITMFFAWLLWNENLRIGIHDNLDSTIANLKMLRDNKAYFGQQTLPFLGGLDRNYFESELKIQSLLYFFFSPFIAYSLVVFLKIILGLIASIFLAKDLLKEQFPIYKPVVILVSFAYVNIPVIPSMALAFSTLPFFFYMLIKVSGTRKVRYFVYGFFFPWFTDFALMGIFLILFIIVDFIIKSWNEKKINFKLLVFFAVFTLGMVISNYRLFSLLLIDDVVTIRNEFVLNSSTFPEILKITLSALVSGQYHVMDGHGLLIFPLLLISLSIKVVNISRDFSLSWKTKTRIIFRTPLFILFMVIVLNSMILGLYESSMIRAIFYNIFPFLNGWNFSRIFWFNPFLWYVALLLMMKDLIDQKLVITAMIISIFSVLIVLCYPVSYNSLQATLTNVLFSETEGALSFKEFYSEALFSDIKDEINYMGEYSIAYGFHPSVLVYNGISTLDGYLSNYPLSYKHSFLSLIGPILENNDKWSTYFNDWGGRAYIFSETDTQIYAPRRVLDINSSELHIDTNQFLAMGGRYIFSRIEITNFSSIGFAYMGSFTHQASPYKIHVYESKLYVGENAR